MLCCSKDGFLLPLFPRFPDCGSIGRKAQCRGCHPLPSTPKTRRKLGQKPPQHVLRQAVVLGFRMWRHFQCYISVNGHKASLRKGVSPLHYAIRQWLSSSTRIHPPTAEDLLEKCWCCSLLAGLARVSFMSSYNTSIQVFLFIIPLNVRPRSDVLLHFPSTLYRRSLQDASFFAIYEHELELEMKLVTLLIFCHP